MNKSVEVIFKGNVHGVGFRYTALDLALKHCVKGFVRNTTAGDVEVAAEGEEKAVNDYLYALNQEMGRFIISSVVNPMPYTGQYADFRIKYGYG